MPTEAFAYADELQKKAEALSGAIPIASQAHIDAHCNAEAATLARKIQSNLAQIK